MGEPESTGDCPPLSLQARRQPLVARRGPVHQLRRRQGEEVGAGGGARQPLPTGRREGMRGGAWPRGRLPAPVAAGAPQAAAEPPHQCSAVHLVMVMVEMVVGGD